jgi:hypothetical protein
MGVFGNLLGQGLGRLGGGLFGQGDLGQNVGGQLGNLLPFKKGGRKKASKPKAKGKATKARKRGGK